MEDSAEKANTYVSQKSAPKGAPVKLCEHVKQQLLLAKSETQKLTDLVGDLRNAAEAGA